MYHHYVFFFSAIISVQKHLIIISLSNDSIIAAKTGYLICIITYVGNTHTCAYMYNNNTQYFTLLYIHIHVHVHVHVYVQCTMYVYSNNTQYFTLLYIHIHVHVHVQCTMYVYSNNTQYFTLLYIHIHS